LALPKARAVGFIIVPAIVRLVRRIGEATQFFYAADDGCHYKMLGVFFLAEFPDQPIGQGEHELIWLPLAEAKSAFFHESHAWAAHQGLEKKMARV
jgi:hypothetical protein